MAAPTITNGEEHFFPIIFSGNGTGQKVGKFVPFTDNGTIAKSVMYNDGDSPYLTRTQESGTGDQKRKATFSWWFKRGTAFGTEMIHVGAAPSTRLLARFDTSDRLVFRLTNGTSEYQKVTNRTFKDNSKWYHCHWQIDVSQSTATDRSKVWIDGDQITSWSSDSNPGQNTDVVGLSDGTTQRIGCGSHFVGQIFDGYLAEFNYCDGVITTVDNFGLTDTSTGRWIPKTLSGINYGTNGFRLQFGTDSALGDDTSGNTNDFSSSGLTTSDQRNDTPTNNLPIMRPYNPSYSQVLYEGNLTTYTNGTNKGYPMVPTLRPKSGKWYAECRVSGDGGGNTVDLGVYLQEDMHNYSSGNWYPGNNNGSGWNSVSGGYGSRGFYQQVGGSSTYVQFISEHIGAGDVIGMALDIDNGLLSYYNNSGSLVGSVPFDNNKTPMFAAMSNTSITFIWNFGDNGTFAGYETAGGNTDSDGNGNFFHSVPSGFKMLTQDNMPETDRGISGFTWLKDRDNATNHYLVNSSRNYKNAVYSNTDDAEVFLTAGLRNPLKGGFEVLDGDPVNGSGRKFVSWNWVANGGTTASNGDGSISSTVQANTDAGFSIVQYTGTGSNGSVGHGLSQAPEWIMVKILNLSSVAGFTVSTTADPDGFNNFLYLNETEVSRAYDNWQNTAPTSSVFTVSSGNAANYSGQAMLAYCWHSVEGYSKFGRYTGNGSADGPFVYTGFKPAFIMVKRTDTAAHWAITDTTRDPFNPTDKGLLPSSSAAEGTGYTLDHNSNGFKIRLSGTAYNASGGTYIYMAFAEHPFVGDGTSPVTAR